MKSKSYLLSYINEQKQQWKEVYSAPVKENANESGPAKKRTSHHSGETQLAGR